MMERIENIHKILYTNIRSSIVHSSQKSGNNPNVQQQTNGQNVVYSYNGLFSHKKEWGTQATVWLSLENTVLEWQKHLGLMVRLGLIRLDCICIKCWIGKSIETESSWMFPEDGPGRGGEIREWLLMGFLFEAMKVFWN